MSVFCNKEEPTREIKVIARVPERVACMIEQGSTDVSLSYVPIGASSGYFGVASMGLLESRPGATVPMAMRAPDHEKVVILLAAQLHREYRAAFKALHSGVGSFMGVGRVKAKEGTGCPNEHDHGWCACHKQAYFFRRARLIIKRATPQTLGEAEEALQAEVLRRRLCQ